MTHQDRINELLYKLELLLKKQEIFSEEVQILRDEILKLKTSTTNKPLEKEESGKAEHIGEQPIYSSKTNSKKLYRNLDDKIIGGVCSGIAKYLGISIISTRIIWVIFSLFYGIGFFIYLILWIILPKGKTTETFKKEQPNYIDKPAKYDIPTVNEPSKIKVDWEKYIGENLINKIGIAIVIIGVAIGTKYSIEHDLISPLTRVILGYLVGLGLLGVGMKLKKEYENFSAVLVSGSMTILYFMTYAAYGFYDLFPQVVAFILMVLFTSFTVIAALNYNKQIVALIGLVGAYAVPFLLSEGAGNVKVLFSYMSIINIGILVIAFKKYWKLLYFSSFILTWLLYYTWYASNFEIAEHFSFAFLFLFLFFAIFYVSFLAFKLIQKEKFEIIDILLLLANSFIFYGIGYSILDDHETGKQLLGVFTLGNGIIHFIVSTIIYRQKLADKNLFYFISGLVLVFITIAIPVQLDGNWVTLLWVGEATLLFWIGRTKNIAIYEHISYPLMILAVFSIFQDWTIAYNLNIYNKPETPVTPLLNIHFLSSLIFIAAFGFINVLSNNNKYTSSLNSRKELKDIVSFLIPTILVGSLYFAFKMEIENYWNQLYLDSTIIINEYEQNHNYDLLKFKTIWGLNYSMLFLSIFSFLNIKKLKNKRFGLINLGFNILVIALFLTQGLYQLSELRESYLEQTLSIYYEISDFNIGIRYVSYAFVALILIACYTYIQKEFMKLHLKMEFDLLLHLSILWIASSELINAMDLLGSSESHKLGLSIFWGIYSLFLIVIGIWKNKKYLRIGAISLFGITLIKLFFYDISHLNTISKTIVFLSLGILLLIISFLYNKFKHIITDEIDR